MHYTLTSNILTWNNMLLQARLLQEMPNYTPHWWFAQPIHPPLPQLYFEVDASGPFPDNYWTGGIIEIYSNRLVTILQAANVRFESFPVILVDKNTREPVNDEYQAFHLLDMQPLSKIRAKDHQGRVVSIAVPSLMFRLEKYIDRVVIHEDLQKVLENKHITGFEFKPYK
jgi:hypothetical protein